MLKGYVLKLSTLSRQRANKVGFQRARGIIRLFSYFRLCCGGVEKLKGRDVSQCYHPAPAHVAQSMERLQREWIMKNSFSFFDTKQ